MTPLLLALLLSFDPSPTPDVIHICHAYERTMGMGYVDGEYVPLMTPWYQVACETGEDEFGWYAVASCGDLDGQACGVCIEAVDEEGDSSDTPETPCGIDEYVEDL